MSPAIPETEEEIANLRRNTLILGLLLMHFGRPVMYNEEDFAALSHLGICVHPEGDKWVCHLVQVEPGTDIEPGEIPPRKEMN